MMNVYAAAEKGDSSEDDDSSDEYLNAFVLFIFYM